MLAEPSPTSRRRTCVLSDRCRLQARENRREAGCLLNLSAPDDRLTGCPSAKDTAVEETVLAVADEECLDEERRSAAINIYKNTPDSTVVQSASAESLYLWIHSLEA